MRHVRQRVFGLLLFWLCVPTALAIAKTQTGFLDRTAKVDGEIYRYQVYLPDTFNKHVSWPVILSLHSVSQRGNDGLQSTDFGIAHAIRMHRDRFPFVVVFPQCRSGNKWVVPEMQRVVLAELEASIRAFHGERRRVYLTGISMGGFGVWEMAAQYPGIFAAYVPIAGGILGPPKVPDARVTVAADPSVTDPYAETARRVGRTPVWIFHGSEDPVVAVQQARSMKRALESVHANFRYTEYPNAGHEVWDCAYAEPDLIPWLLAQHR